MRILMWTLVLTAIFSKSADAYIGPGLGLETIGVAIGFMVSIVAAMFAVVWYPLKKLFSFLAKKNHKKTESSE